jgi:alkylation response protein AidB-like acyl-CoA dehydrogenase
MYFGLTETQRTIKKSAKDFFSKECPISEVRRMMETESAIDGALWKKLAEQGWTGIIFPEQYGGFGLGLVDMAVALEEMGRALVPGPFLSTVLLAGSTLEKAGSEEQKHKYLAPICRGHAKSTLALLEKSVFWDPGAVTMEAQVADRDYRLTGEKFFVRDAGIADFLIVAAKLAGEPALFLVDGNAAGLRKVPTPGMDLTRRLHRLTFEDTPGDLLAAGERARQALEGALDIAAVAISAEMVGGMQRLVDLTVEYAKTRKQFGRPIGSFQAVQHMCADMLVLLEGARSAAYYAAWALNENDPAADAAVSVAKAYASEGYRDCGNRSIQVQGGMGFTWENDAHLYSRRAKGSEMAFGDAIYHRERIAKIIIDKRP